MLFMLSFSVMHDSVISYMQTNDHTVVTHYAQVDKGSSQEIHDIHEIHSMFHFVGLIVPYVHTFIPQYEEELYAPNLLQYTTVDKETSFKPPIA